MEEIRTNENEAHEVEKLQHEMTQRVASMHSVAFSGPEEELRGNTLRNDQMQEQLRQPEGLYSKIPEGYHLDIQITPQAYYRLGAEKNSWLRREINKEEIDYSLRVARNVNCDDLESNVTALNIKALGGVGAMNVFGLQKVSRERIVPGEFIKPQDILNMNIKQNPRK